jgi:hypothetical protein
MGKTMTEQQVVDLLLGTVSNAYEGVEGFEGIVSLTRTAPVARACWRLMEWEVSDNQHEYAQAVVSLVREAFNKLEQENN